MRCAAPHHKESSPRPDEADVVFGPSWWLREAEQLSQADRAGTWRGRDRKPGREASGPPASPLHRCRRAPAAHLPASSSPPTATCGAGPGCSSRRDHRPRRRLLPPRTSRPKGLPSWGAAHSSPTILPPEYFLSRINTHISSALPEMTRM